MKNKKRNIIIISSSLFMLLLGIFFVSKGSYAASDNYTYKEMRNMVVSTALSYYYNNLYTDYDQTSMDEYNTIKWTNLNISPEMVSRNNYYVQDSFSFVNLVYLHSLGYDMSENYTLSDTSYVNEKGETKQGKKSVANYQTAYMEYGKSWTANYLSSVADELSDKSGEPTISASLIYKYNEYDECIENCGGHCYYNQYYDQEWPAEPPWQCQVEIDDKTKNNLIVAYNYHTKINENNTYGESDGEKIKIIDQILENLQPGDIFIYRKKNINNNGITSYAMIYVGDIFGNGEHGFIHTTGSNSFPDATPVKINKDNNSIKYDTWETSISSRMFEIATSSSPNVSYSMSIIRPINWFCYGTTCTFNKDKIQSPIYKQDKLLNDTYEEHFENTLARTELKYLNIEQYQTRENTPKNLNPTSSINLNEKVVYNLKLTNKSNLGYCSLADYGYNGQTECESNGYKWKTSKNKTDYNNLTVTGTIPDGTEYVSCTENCIYDKNSKTVTWKNVSITAGNNKTYTYTVKVVGCPVEDMNGEPIENCTAGFNPSMKITTKNNNKMTMGELKLEIHPTLNNKTNMTTMNESIEKFQKLVENKKITYGDNGHVLDYRKDLDNLSSATISQFGFIKMLYYDTYGIDFGYLTEGSIKTALFEDGYYMRIKNQDFTTEEKNIIKMLVPGLYGGRKLKGKNASYGERTNYLSEYDLVYGDIIVTYDTDNNTTKTYLFKGFDTSDKPIIVSFGKSSNNTYKVLFYDNQKTDGDTAWNVYKSIFAQDLFAVFRPSQLYGTTVVQDNGDETSEVLVEYKNYQNLPTPKRNGHIFEGWYSDAAYTKKVENNNKLISEKSHTLYAKWTKYSLKIEFSSSLNVSGNIIKNVAANTTYENLKSKIITDGDFEIKSSTGNIKNNTDKVVTGDTIKISKYDESNIYKVSVLGDFTGDGIVDITDAKKIAEHIINKNQVAQEYLLAADLTNDGKVKMNDVMKLLKTIGNTKK